MKKGKESVIYISDDETTTDHSEEEVELNNGEMMNAPEEKAMSDEEKLAELKAAKRRQAKRATARRLRENESNYITNLENEEEKLKFENSKTTKSIKLYEKQCELLQIERQSWKTRLQQSLLENRRLQQGDLQQEQSGAPNAAQDPNSMLEPQQIQTSGLSHQHAHQLIGPHNAADHSYGIMVPQQILTSGLSHQLAHQPGGPHNAAYHSSGMMVPQQIQTRGPSHQQAHQSGGPNNAAYHSVGIMVPQQILTSELSHQPGGPHNAAYHSSGIMVPQQIQTRGSSPQPAEPHNAAHHSYGILETNADINGVQEPGMRELGQSSASQKGVYDNPSGTWVAWLESSTNDSDQDVPSPQLSADDSVLGSEMPSTAQLQEGMSSTYVEKATSDAGQIE